MNGSGVTGSSASRSSVTVGVVMTSETTRAPASHQRLCALWPKALISSFWAFPRPVESFRRRSARCRRVCDSCRELPHGRARARLLRGRRKLGARDPVAARRGATAWLCRPSSVAACPTTRLTSDRSSIESTGPSCSSAIPTAAPSSPSPAWPTTFVGLGTWSAVRSSRTCRTAGNADCASYRHKDCRAPRPA